MEGLKIEAMNLHTTDAVPNREIQCVSQDSQRTIDSRVLQRVEEELEEFEKISILFLLAAEKRIAYERVIELCRNIQEHPNIIAEFIDNDLDMWGEMLIEALCIIGNREILRNLGYSVPDLELKYHPNIPSYTMKVHKVSKVLYKLFETLGNDRTKVLLGRIYEEDQIERKFTDSCYLELHAFYWLHINYIIISRDGGNLSKLLKHLKHMGYYSESIYHDVELFSTSSSQSDSSFVGRSSLQEYPEAPTRNGPQSTNDITKVQELKRGKCVIINQVRFAQPYENREGSDTDRDALVQVFSAMNFEIITRENLTEGKLMDFLKEISDGFDDTKYDSLVVCILTHGYEGGIVTCEGKEIPIAVLDDKICTQKLRDTVKLLIVQACQGKTTGDASERSQLATDGSELATDGSRLENILRHRHFFRFMSTMDGFAAIRHKRTGSWFVQSLCKVLSRKERISIADWAAAVTQTVSSMKGCLNGCRAASQLPQFTSRLEGSIYFPPYKENVAVEAAPAAR